MNGRRVRVIVARDSTERKALHARLALADRLASVGTLAGGVAHEINNPLSYVLINLELIAGTVAGLNMPPDQRAAMQGQLSDALEGARRVRSIVNDLRAFVSMGEGARGPVNVEDVLEGAVKMTHSVVRHRARLVKRFCGASQVLANRAQLSQVFVHLIINAANAITEGRGEENEISLTTAVAKDRVVVEVRDSGAGIAQELLHRVFDPFFTTHMVGSGVGMGLSICHGIITALGGEISVESEPGKGCLVRVSLPAASAQSEAPQAPEVQLPARPGGRARVMVIDDDLEIGVLMQRALTPEHDVVTVDSARHALRRIESGERFDVILCDLLMPEMSGMELHDTLLKSYPELARRVVFVTAGARTGAAREFLDTVRNPLVTKPFERAQIRAAVAQMIAHQTLVGGRPDP